MVRVQDVLMIEVDALLYTIWPSLWFFIDAKKDAPVAAFGL